MKSCLGTRGVLLLIALIFVPAIAFSAPSDVPAGAMCGECGMKVDAKSPFAAQAVTKEKVLAFCDIGDMLYHYKNTKDKPDKIYVKDYKSNSWIDAVSAYFVKSSNYSSPMGWGIAAFKDQKEAAASGKPMTFQEALSALGDGASSGDGHKTEHGEHMKH